MVKYDWELNYAAIFRVPGWREWQAGRPLHECLTVLRWFIEGAIPRG